MASKAQMIYSRSNVAAMIAARLTKSRGVKYEVTKVDSGFRVAPVPQVATVEIAMELKSVAPQWLCAFYAGKNFWAPRSALISWDAGLIKMSKAYAVKRGLAAA
jgi:hypothetical protein